MTKMDPISEVELAGILEMVYDRESISASSLGDWLGLTPNRINALAREGVLPRDSQNRFPLRESVRAYAIHARARATGRQSDPELSMQRLRLATETADKLAFHNARARGDLLDAATVAREWQGVIKDLRAALLAVPSRVAGLAGLDRRATAAFEVEMRAAMEAIALDPAIQSKDSHR